MIETVQSLSVCILRYGIVMVMGRMNTRPILSYLPTLVWSIAWNTLFDALPLSKTGGTERIRQVLKHSKKLGNAKAYAVTFPRTGRRPIFESGDRGE